MMSAWGDLVIGWLAVACSGAKLICDMQQQECVGLELSEQINMDVQDGT